MHRVVSFDELKIRRALCARRRRVLEKIYEPFRSGRFCKYSMTRSGAAGGAFSTEPVAFWLERLPLVFAHPTATDHMSQSKNRLFVFVDNTVHETRAWNAVKSLCFVGFVFSVTVLYVVLRSYHFKCTRICACRRAEKSNRKANRNCSLDIHISE